MSMRIDKTYASQKQADAAYLWYASTDRRHRPKNVTLCDKTHVLYDIVDGQPCWQPELAWQTLKRCVWDTTREDALPGIDLHSYCRYVQDVWEDSYLPYYRVDPHAVECVLETLLSQADQLTPVRMVHGDATLLNFIQSHDGRITMIDPGDPRGMYVRELDESKMLQSLHGYDRLCLGYDRLVGAKAPFVVRNVHWSLLATHCVRLIPHQRRRGREDLVRWAISTIQRISEGDYRCPTQDT